MAGFEKGKKYEVVDAEQGDCIGFCFNEICRDIYEIVCQDFKCYAGERKDGKNVQFKRVK